MTRDRQINVRLSDATRDRLRQQAEARGLSLSEYARILLEDGSYPDAPTPAQLRALADDLESRP